MRSIVFAAVLATLLPTEARADPEGPGPLIFELGGHDPVKIRLGASVWGRGEIRDEATRNGAILQRTRAELQMRWRLLGTFAQVQDVRSWGEEPSTLANTPSIGLHQGYASISGRRGGFSGLMRVGRMEHVFGSGYLITNAPWNPNARAFDAANVRLKIRMIDVDLFAAMLATPATHTGTIDGQPVEVRSPGDYMTGSLIQAALHPAAIVEASVVTASRAATETELQRSRIVVSPSLRLRGSVPLGLRYELEGWYQAGRWDTQSHAAWAAHGELGYQIDLNDIVPEVVAGYAIASGDRCTGQNAPDSFGLCADGKHRAFDPMVGYRHRILGLADQFLFSNVRDLSGSARVNIEDQLKFRFDYHWFQLDQVSGAWTRINETPITASPVSIDPDVSNTAGHEFDAVMSIIPWKPFTITVGYAGFFRAGVGRLAIVEKVRHFGWMQMQLKF